MHDDAISLPNSTWCFVCGEDNQAGLRARFYVEDEIVKMSLRVQPHHCGYLNTVHGGIVAAALDECMGWAAARAIKRMCLTGELTVRYIQPVPADKDLIVCGEIARAHRRIVHATGQIVDHEGHTYARAEGRFLPMSEEETRKIDGMLLYRGGDERVFEGL